MVSTPTSGQPCFTSRANSKPLRGAGHVDVSQHSGDFGSPTKHVEGLVSVLRLRNPEPGFTQDIDLNHPH